MKFLIALFISLISTSMFAGESYDYWFCSQMGHIDGTKILVITDIHYNMKNIPHDVKNSTFENSVQKETRGKFEAQYEGYCINYEQLEKASSHLERIIERAIKLGFQILKVDPNFKEKDNV